MNTPTPSSDMSDDQFLADFLACRLAKEDFNHHGHLRAAWLLLQRHPLEEAIERCCSGIERLATHFGAATKFHRTRSEALLRLMARGRAGSHAVSWQQFLRNNQALLDDARGMLARHYSAAALDAPEARLRFMPPDLLPLPT